MKKKKKACTNNQKQALLSIAAVISLFICLMIYTFWPKRAEKNEKQESVASSNSTEQSEVVEETTSSTETEFVLLESKEPTLQGNTDIRTGKDAEGNCVWEQSKDKAEKYCTPETQLEGKVSAIGNPIYRVPIEFMEDYDVDSEGGYIEVQLSGWTPLLATGEEQYRLARQEKTGKKIYVFDYEEEESAFKKSWEKGQKILSGQEAADEGTILLNGRYVSGANYKKIGNEIYIPLVPVVNALHSPDNHISSDNIMFGSPNPTGEFFCRVPFDFRQIGETHSGSSFEAYVGQGMETFTMGSGDFCYVPASELSRYTGWYIYANDKAIHVITDELDVSDLSVLRDVSQKMEIYETSNGKVITQYTEPGELMDEALEEENE